MKYYRLRMAQTDIFIKVIQKNVTSKLLEKIAHEFAKKASKHFNREVKYQAAIDFLEYNKGVGAFKDPVEFFRTDVDLKYDAYSYRGRWSSGGGKMKDTIFIEM